MKKILAACALVILVMAACSKSNGGGGGNSNPKVTILGKWNNDHTTLITVQSGLLLDSANVPHTGVTYDFINDSVVVIATTSQGGNPQSSDTLSYSMPDATHLVLQGITNDLHTLDANSLIFSQTAGNTSIYTEMTWFLSR